MQMTHKSILLSKRIPQPQFQTKLYFLNLNQQKTEVELALLSLMRPLNVVLALWIISKCPLQKKKNKTKKPDNSFTFGKQINAVVGARFFQLTGFLRSNPIVSLIDCKEVIHA